MSKAVKIDMNGNLHDTAGKFAEKQNTAPAGTLAPQASFLFPPPSFETAEEMIRFFETQPISDRVLSNFQHGWRMYRNRQLVDAVRPTFEAWAASKKIVRLEEQNPSAAFDIGEKYLSDLLTHEGKKWPERIKPADLRSAVIALQILRSPDSVLYYASTESRDAVLDHQLPVFGGTSSVRALVDKWHLEYWADRCLTENDLAVQDAARMPQMSGLTMRDLNWAQIIARFE